MSANRMLIGAAALVLAAALGGCAPQGSPAPDASTGPSSPSGVGSPPSSAGPTPSASPGPYDISLPTDCRAVYSPSMLASLEQENPPLNDPGVSMLSSGDASLLEMLDVVPTIRCSWGGPSDTGLSTNISIVDAEQSAAVASTLMNAGFGCEEQDAATICRIEQRGLNLDDVEYVRGETHALRGNAWVATAWLNFSPEGYTEDILATLGE